MVNPAVIATLKELERNGNPGLLADLVKLFQRKIPEAIQEMKDAIASGNPSQLGRSAHNLKSSCGNLGAVEMSRLAAELMEYATAANLEPASLKVEELRQEFITVEKELTEALRG
jgi:HPt (histidine-containing phosphotransfer) domain-containing protein